MESNRTCIECGLVKPIVEFFGGQTRTFWTPVISKRCKACRAAIEKRRQEAKKNGLHICTRCKLAKPIDQFGMRGKYIACYCNPCFADIQRERRIALGKPIRRRQRRDIGNETDGFFCCRCNVQKPISHFKKRTCPSGNRWNYVCRECHENRYLIGNKHLETEFADCQRRAAKRQFSWSLTFEQFAELRSKTCHYCTFPIQISAGVGLDRIDSKQGYSVDNVVPCCPQCNICKSNHFSLEEMELIGKAIKQVRENRIAAGKPPTFPRQ